ncbi:hypothetical protein [Deinococcus marmoris]|uniref:Uncharacterized protein n=1 Tax=Deinococcus marmoris TaxID=249408 RepID=A0A1U7NWJ8_9DEIO|nr:hypothetical protein [Deinococcus marmoris]OLV17308.1 hypothetical protein BOO71_0009220 [Deinococcus marmoris]
MTQPPPSFPELPITAAELAAARAGVTVRGGRIMGTLGVLAALSALGGLLGFWALWWSFGELPRWLASLNELSDGDLPQLNAAELVPAWALPSLLGLGLLATALYVWAILVARQTVGAVWDQTLNPGPDHTGALERSVRTVRPWIVLGQIAPILQLLIPLLAVPLTFGLIRQLDPQTFQGVGFGPAEIGAIVLGVVVQSLPTVIITWLILAAIRRWLDAVVARAHTPVPVRPAARGVDPWLLFTLVLLVLGLAGLLLGGLPLLAFSAFVGSAPLNDPDLAALGITPAALRAVLLVGAAAMLLGAFIYLLLTLLMGWSRGFASNVATVLDAGLPGRPVMPAHDPWSGPVQPAQGREPY